MNYTDKSGGKRTGPCMGPKTTPAQACAPGGGKQSTGGKVSTGKP